MNKIQLIFGNVDAQSEWFFSFMSTVFFDSNYKFWVIAGLICKQHWYYQLNRKFISGYWPEFQSQWKPAGRNR